MSHPLSLHHITREPQTKGLEKAGAIFLFHGIGSNENDLFSFASHLPDSYHVISCRAPMPYGIGGYAWYEIQWLPNGEKISNIPQAKNAVKIINTFIDEAVEKYQLDKDKLIFCGFSQGAILSYSLSLQFPEKAKAVIAMSGYLNTEILEIEPEKEKVKTLPVFISHGTEDPVIPVMAARKTRNYLEELGIKANYHEYPMEHGVSPENFQDMLQFLRINT